MDRDLALKAKQLTVMKRAFEQRIKEITAELEPIKEQLREELMNDSAKSITVLDEDGNPFKVTLRVDRFVSYDDAETFHEFLSEHGLDNLRKVHHQTLQAFVKDDLPSLIGAEDMPTDMLLKIGLQATEKRTVRIS